MSKNEKSSFFNQFVFYYTKLIGLNPLDYRKNYGFEFSYIGLVYNTFLAIIFTFGFTKALKYRRSIILWEETQLAVLIDFYANTISYLFIISSWFTFIFRIKTINRIFELLRIIENYELKLKVNGVKRRFKNLKIINRNFIFVNIFFYIFMGSNMFVNYLCQDMKNQSLFWFYYNLPANLHINIPFILIKLMMIFKEHFNLLNVKVKDILENEYFDPLENNSCILFVKKVKRKFYLFLWTEKCKSISIYALKLQLVGTIHTKLINVCELVIKLFSLPLLLILVYSLYYVILASHGIYQFLKNLEEQSIGDTCILYTPMTRAIVYSSITFFTCNVPTWIREEVRFYSIWSIRCTMYIHVKMYCIFKMFFTRPGKLCTYFIEN